MSGGFSAHCSLEVSEPVSCPPKCMLCVCESLSRVRLCDRMHSSPPGSSVHGILQNTGVGYNALVQGIFLTQELKPGLLHCR